LKELNPEIEVVAVQPDGPFHGLEGLKHLATTIVPGIYDPELPDRTEFVSTEDAEDAVRQLAKQAGLLAGWSTGAALVAAARKLAVPRVPPVNQRTDAARNRYLIDPESFRRAQEKLDRDGLEVIGVYHSHPDHAAAPSTFDREHAWPWLSYVIVGVARGRAGEMTSWTLSDDRAAFDEESITIEEQKAVWQSPS